MKQGKKVTIKDIAREAGASIATVSRVLNGRNYPVSNDLRARILDAVRRLDYAPGAAAASSRRSASRDIGVLIPNITNPFYPQAFLGIEAVLREKGYNILLFNTFRSIQRERECLKLLMEKQVRGVIISMVEGEADDLVRYADHGMQFVLLDQTMPGLNCPSINFDSRRGAMMAIEHLLKNGHGRIAFATTPLVRSSRIDTHRGYREALAAADIPYRGEYVFISPSEPEEEHQNYELDAGRAIAGKFLSEGCDATAIFCVNDMLAIGVMNALIESGVRIPEDVSIVGFDDIAFAGVYNPQLTTVHSPIYDTGKLAAMLLLENMVNSGRSQIAFNVNLEPTLVERKTVRNLTRNHL
ncbi:MAG: LacI family transcriptional regulator [Clostridiales bacterium]|nr:LacI family transcriptional regulator [Clostridiales bacterium]